MHKSPLDDDGDVALLAKAAKIMGNGDPLAFDWCSTPAKKGLANKIETKLKKG